jgi:hypothetical protein
MAVSEGRLGSGLQTDETSVQYPVNIRVTIPLLPSSVFITFIIGRERRGHTRLQQERLRHPLNTWGNLLTFVVASTVFTVAALFCALVMAAL